MAMTGFYTYPELTPGSPPSPGHLYPLSADSARMNPQLAFTENGTDPQTFTSLLNKRTFIKTLPVSLRKTARSARAAVLKIYLINQHLIPDKRMSLGDSNSTNMATADSVG